MKQAITKLFRKTFGKNPISCYFSPGRVNIIGGHTDYNGGAVLPFCIDLGIYGAVRFRDDEKVSIFSQNLAEKGIISFELSDLNFLETRDFANYASGIIHELKQKGYIVNRGFDLALSGNLPKGGGLSSSASLSILICMLLNDHFSFGLDGPAMAMIAKATENNYIGVNCGIMDQFVIAMGKQDMALYLETADLTYEYVPLKCDDYVFMLINSNTTRKLSESHYNTRQAESQTILSRLKNTLAINHICELSPAAYECYIDLLPEDHLQRRFKHLVDEHDRVKKARQALKIGDYSLLGQLLNEAHHSASQLYEVSSDRLDDLVAMATKSGSIGSKMIGGGFGGSTLNLIPTASLEQFVQTFTALYQSHFSGTPQMTLVKAASGARQL